MTLWPIIKIVKHIIPWLSGRDFPCTIMVNVSSNKNSLIMFLIFKSGQCTIKTPRNMQPLTKKQKRQRGAPRWSTRVSIRHSRFIIYHTRFARRSRRTRFHEWVVDILSASPVTFDPILDRLLPVTLSGQFSAYLILLFPLPMLGRVPTNFVATEG